MATLTNVLVRGRALTFHSLRILAVTYPATDAMSDSDG